MGYSTDFFGAFSLNKKLDDETHTFLNKFNETRRMKRNIKGFGVDGELYVDGRGSFGQDDDGTVVDHNKPPSTQPSLWCQWKPNEAGTAIEWDGGEKFYSYVEWIKYIISKILAPRGYVLNGEVKWQGEENSDFGVISIKDNKIFIQQGIRQYGSSQEA